MLPPREKNLTCAVCGIESEYWIGDNSHTNFGQPDLDLRPPEMGRRLIGRLVQRCKECGYCASEIDADTILEEMSIEDFWDFEEEVFEIVYSSAYKKQLNDPKFPELANSFLCKAHIEIKLSNPEDALWSIMNAAWACDDANEKNAAESCRLEALNLISKAHSENKRLITEDESDAPLQVDLLRRIGKFEEAQEIISNELPKIENKKLISILNYQEELLKNKDDKCRRIPDDDD